MGSHFCLKCKGNVENINLHMLRSRFETFIFLKIYIAVFFGVFYYYHYYLLHEESTMYIVIGFLFLVFLNK